MIEFLLPILNFPAKILALLLANVLLFSLAIILALLIIRPLIRFFAKEKVSVGYESSKTISNKFLLKPYTPIYGFSGLLILLIKFFIFVGILSFAYAYALFLMQYAKYNVLLFNSQFYLAGISLAGLLLSLVLFFGTNLNKLRETFNTILHKETIFNYENKEIKGLSLIGGYNSIKEQLKQAVENILSDNPIKPNGILLYGPPGCGKTYFAEKLAEEFGIKYRKIHLDEIKSMWMNESVEKVGEIFRTAMNESPCMIVFEEADSILMRRDEKVHSEDKKVTNAFLTYMDDLRKSNAKVVVVATTNFYDKLDKASIRQGRFDFHIKINRPSAEDLKEIISATINSIVAKENITEVNAIQEKNRNLTQRINRAFNVFSLFLLCIFLFSLTIYGTTYIFRPHMEKIRLFYETTPFGIISFLGIITSIGLLFYKNKFIKKLATRQFTTISNNQNKQIAYLKELIDIDKLADYFEGRATSEVKSTIEYAYMKKQFSTENIISLDKEVKKLQRNAVPSVSWDEVIINENVKEQLIKTEKVISNYKKYKKQLLDTPKGLILYGDPGTGKTLIAKAIASNADCAFYHLKVSDLISSYVGESEKKIAEIYAQARKTAPSIVFIDEADAIFSQRNSISKNHTGLVNQILQEIEGFEDDTDIVFTIMATNYIENIDKAIKSRLGLHIQIPKPDKNSRKKLFSLFLSKINTEGTFNYDKLAELTEGATGRDIKNLINKAVSQNIDKPLTEAMIINAIEKEKGTQKPVMETLYTWDDLVVQPEIKKQLRVIEKIFKEPEKAKQMGINKSLNVMFYGPPGTGKTFAAKILASQVKADFKEIQSGELKAGIIGETEKKIRELFEWLRSRPSAILFIDEAESLLAPRQNVRHEYSISVVNQFLSELQGFREESRGYHMVCISTNHPDMIDPAVLSRFTFKIEFPLPDFEERKQILKNLLNGFRYNIDIEMFAKITEGYSGRDIRNLVEKAKFNAFSDDRNYLLTTDFLYIPDKK